MDQQQLSVSGPEEGKGVPHHGEGRQTQWPTLVSAPNGSMSLERQMG